jgi:urease accessory protein UreE
MICDRVIRNLGDEQPAGGISLSLTWQECRSRALAKLLPDGRWLRVILPPGVVLHHGDVLDDEPGSLIYVQALPADVLVIRAGPSERVRVIYAFGNLHLPMQLDGDEILTPADGPARAVLRDLGLTATTDRRRFDPLPLPNGLTFRLSPDFTTARS